MIDRALATDGISGFLAALPEPWLPTIYRLAAYFMLSVLDDPAMLALAFC